jgi:hypothetical protein
MEDYKEKSRRSSNEGVREVVPHTTFLRQDHDWQHGSRAQLYAKLDMQVVCNAHIPVRRALTPENSSLGESCSSFAPMNDKLDIIQATL